MRIDDRQPGVVRVTLDSAATGNRLDDDLLGALLPALDRAEATPDARVLVLGAVGPAFCSGLDLTDLDEVVWRPRIARIVELLRRLAGSPLVTVAMVDGVATGGGVGLAAACDQVVAGPAASFRLTEVQLGLIPAAILPALSGRVGAQCAFSMALTAESLSARDARDCGLADRLGGDDELRRLLRMLRAADPAAVRALKLHRHELSVESDLRGEQVASVLAERLGAAATRDRLAQFREQGLFV